MTRHAADPADVARIVELYRAGVPIKEIAAELGYSETSVSRIARQNGCGPRARTGGIPSPPIGLAGGRWVLRDGVQRWETT